MPLLSVRIFDSDQSEHERISSSEHNRGVCEASTGWRSVADAAKEQEQLAGWQAGIIIRLSSAHVFPSD